MTLSNLKLRKNFVWNFVGTFVYAFTSLFFMMIVTRINGVEEAGVFTFAFSFACMTQVIALYQGRTYQVTDRSGKTTDSDYLLFRVITCVAMLIFGIVFAILRQYDISKMSIIVILLLYKCIDAFAESYYGIFQNNNNLYQAGISYMLKGILSTLCFLAVDIATQNLLLSTIGILVGDIVVVAIYDYPRLRKYKIKLRCLKWNIIKFFTATGFAVFIVTYLTQYLVNAQKYVVDFVGTSSDQAILGVLIMPATLISLCAQLIINPFLYEINQLLKQGKYKDFKNLVLKICLWLLLFGVIVLIVAYFIGIPVMKLIFAIDLDNCLLPLMLILLGSIFFGLVCILSNSMIALRKTTSQVIYYLIASISSTVSSVLLVQEHGVLGASVSFCISYGVLLLLFVFAFAIWYKRINK